MPNTHTRKRGAEEAQDGRALGFLRFCCSSFSLAAPPGLQEEGMVGVFFWPDGDSLLCPRLLNGSHEGASSLRSDD